MFGTEQTTKIRPSKLRRQALRSDIVTPQFNVGG